MACVIDDCAERLFRCVGVDPRDQQRVVRGQFLIKSADQSFAAGFGQISYPESLRLVIPAVTCMTLAVQTIFSSFFLSVLDLEHD